MKKSSFKFLILVTGLLITCFAVQRQIEASTTAFYYVSNCVGETYDQVGISYHTKLANSKVVLSTNSNLSGGTTYTPTVNTWSRSVIKENSTAEVGFPDDRYVCRVNFTGLAANTTYYYQISAGSTTSSIYSFKTLPNSNKTVFAWITDSQTYAGSYQSVQNVIEALVSVDKEIGLVVNTGDVVDDGGAIAQWEGYFSKVTAASTMLTAAVPGNHEYYIENLDYNTGTPEIFNQFFNNPQNGATERLNTSYYFKYNNVLFIMLDTIQTNSGKPQDFEAQKAWFDAVCEANESEFIIVGMHLGLYGAASYASAAKNMRYYWEETFENNSVDLVLSGHEHLFSATYPVYKQKVDIERGVTYVVGNAAGNKTSTINSQEDYTNRQYVLSSTNYSGAVITVEDGVLTLALYDSLGKAITDSSLEPIKIVIQGRKTKATSFNLSTFRTTSRFEYDEEFSSSKWVWRNNIYGQVSKIEIVQRGVENPPTFTLSTISSITRSISLGNTYTDRNYFYRVYITLADGTVEETTIELINVSSTRLADYQEVLNFEKGEGGGGNNGGSGGCNFGTVGAFILSASLLVPLIYLRKGNKE